MIAEEIMCHLSIILINNINWIVIQREDLKQILKSIINMGQRDAFYVTVLRFLKFTFCDFFSPSKLMFLCLFNFSLLPYFCFIFVTEYILGPQNLG